MKKKLICNNCGHIHFEISELEVIDGAKVFKEYFDKLPEEKKLKLYKRKTFSIEESVRSQKKCFKCGNPNDNFHEENELDEIPIGITIQGIINGLK